MKRVHETALRMQRDGCHVLLIGRAGHVEVRGIVEDLQRFDVIESAAEAKTYPAQKLAVICQTTVAPRTVAAVKTAIVAANPQAEIRFVDTTCQPTGTGSDRLKSSFRLYKRWSWSAATTRTTRANWLSCAGSAA